MIADFFPPFLTLELLVFLWIIGKDRWFSLKMILYLSSILLVCFFVSVLFKDPYSTLLIYLFWVLQFYLSYRKTGTFLLPTIFIVLQNTYISLSWMLLYDFPFFLIKPSEHIRHPIEEGSVYVVQMLFLCFLIFILKKLDKRMSLWSSLSRVAKKHTFFSILSVSLYFTILFFRQRTILLNDRVGYFYLSVFLLIYAFSFITVVCTINEKFQNESYIELLSKEMVKSHQQIVNISEFQHDYKALLISLNRYLDLKDFAGAKKYLNKLEKYSNKILSVNQYDQINTVPLIPLQGLLIDFAERCEKSGIDLTINIKSISSQINMGTIDLLRCFSILLNNALESSAGEVFISLKEKDNLITICISNNFRGDLELSNIFWKGYSNKPAHKGLGLSTFVKIIKKYSNLHYSVESKENYITFTLFIKQ